MPSRRKILKGILGVGGAAVGLSLLAPDTPRAAGAATIRLMSDKLGEHAWFDPVGLWVLPGTKVTWVNVSNVHTVSAYHPKNKNHMLRIPKAAVPFASDYLVEPGTTFSVTLTVPGVYDYYCEPHEAAGMVGRIIVGAPAGGPGTRGFVIPRGRKWLPVPPDARKAFPSIAEIMSKRIVRRRR